MEAGLPIPAGAISFVTFSRPCRGAKRAGDRRQDREAVAEYGWKKALRAAVPHLVKKVAALEEDRARLPFLIFWSQVASCVRRHRGRR